MNRNDRLGRGLGALLGEYMGPPEVSRENPLPAGIPVRAIAPNPFQPRGTFSAAELSELAHSIKVNGLLQPILVRRTASGKGYEVVTGERRLRAVKQLGWADIPALVRAVDDQTLLVLALVENIQREDLGPLEEAEGYHVLRNRFGYTQQEIASAVGKSRSAVANTLRLRGLPAPVRRLFEDGKLTMGHARAILAVEDPLTAKNLARKVAAEGWSVRETEKKVKELSKDHKKEAQPTTDVKLAVESDPTIAALEGALADHMGARVSIRWKGKGAGSIKVAFRGASDLERIVATVTGT